VTDDLDAVAAASYAYADAIRAATDLVDRTGARELDLGYWDGALPGQAYWFAHVEYAGARVSVENHRGPAEALEALARRLLTGTHCPHCGRPVTLTTDEDAAEDRRCHYRRVGPRWVRGCEPACRPSAKRRHRHHRHRRRRH
jgi:hypothetical protein